MPIIRQKDIVVIERTSSNSRHAYEDNSITNCTAVDDNRYLSLLSHDTTSNDDWKTPTNTSAANDDDGDTNSCSSCGNGDRGSNYASSSIYNTNARGCLVWGELCKLQQENLRGVLNHYNYNTIANLAEDVVGGDHTIRAQHPLPEWYEETQRQE